MSRSLYEFQLPALIDEGALLRLRGGLDMRSTMSIRHYDLSLRTVRVRARAGRHQELRALFAELGFPPMAEDPASERRRRLGRSRRWRKAEQHPWSPVAAPLNCTAASRQCLENSR
ncbi:hypothetical protein [uncultured Nevskia sp.]|uniref:hypothetical protein n=1 Tax=uncultured Nevskia sp. TaxID=228950 RepID=UPI0025F46505|nr:hypothetical protein [uncultured Nevskia sp.]